MIGTSFPVGWLGTACRASGSARLWRLLSRQQRPEAGLDRRAILDRTRQQDRGAAGGGDAEEALGAARAERQAVDAPVPGRRRHERPGDDGLADLAASARQ